MSDHLNVWMNDRLLGRWSRRPTRFTYEESWLSSPEAYPLSLSLPMSQATHEGSTVESFFENLLPEDPNSPMRLHAYNLMLGEGRYTCFEFLRAIGRDCVGGTVVLPEGQAPRSGLLLPISEEEVAEVLRVARTSTSPWLPANPQLTRAFRCALPGAQPKIALTWHNGRWYVPTGSIPSTHILKTGPLDQLQNELLCARILAAYGVPVADCELAWFGSEPALVVKRFDRRATGGGWVRLHHEDLCQATATPSTRKYEADGGPGLRDLRRVLAGPSSPEADGNMLLLVQILFFLLAATDGHAKNFSIRHSSSGFRLAPLYDVSSGWPSGRHPRKLKLAMAHRGKHKHYRVAEIERRHLVGNATPEADEIVDRTLDLLPAALAHAYSQTANQLSPLLTDAVERGSRWAAQRLRM